MTFMRSIYGVAAAAAMASTPAIAQDSFGSQPSPQPQPQPAPQPVQQPQPAPQPQPMQQPQPQQQSGGQQFGQQPNFSQATQMEEQDFGVAPTAQLYTGPMHGPTPTKIPGGLVITTEALWMTLQQNGGQMLILDVLGGQMGLPGAQNALPAAQPGSFNDQTQQEFGQYLAQMTGGNKATPLVLYCQNPQCWMSYNAALRAINMGYTQVLWYRGGIEAWQMAGLQTFAKQ